MLYMPAGTCAGRERESVRFREATVSGRKVNGHHVERWQIIGAITNFRCFARFVANKGGGARVLFIYLANAIQ